MLLREDKARAYMDIIEGVYKDFLDREISVSGLR
jgi:hypothetical protein